MFVRYLSHISDPARRDRMVADLAAAMPRHEVGDYLRAKPTILAESPHLALAEQNGRCVGLMAASDLDADGIVFTYIETLLLGEHLHGTGVATELASVLFGGVVAAAGGFPNLVVMKTYTPKAYVLMRRFAVHPDVGFYPALDGSDDHALPARLARRLSPECEFRHGVMCGGGGRISSWFWRDTPLSGDIDVDGYFREHVGDRDRVLCVVSAPNSAGKDALTDALGIRPTTLQI